jgi:hypothetical protein
MKRFFSGKNVLESESDDSKENQEDEESKAELSETKSVDESISLENIETV